jgi:UPF0716 family protein affecting phage T7 exclusion
MNAPAGIVAFGYAYVIAAFFNALLVLAKEEVPGLRSWMEVLTGHHWITHGVAVTALFFIVGFALAQTSLRSNASTLAWWIAGATIASAALIDGFFLFVAS